MIDMFAHMPFGPRITFAPEDGTGNTPDTDTSSIADAANEAAREAAEAERTAAEEEAAIADLEKKAASENDASTARELLREVMKRKEKQRAAEEAATAANQRVAQLEAELAKFSGIDLDEVKQLLKEKADREKAEAEAKGEFERVKQMMISEHQKEVGELKAELEKRNELLAAREGQINDLLIGNAFATSPFILGELTLTPSKARQLYGSHFEIKDGVIVAYDKPAGKPDRTPLVDGAGKPLGFEAAMQRIIDADPEKATLLRAKLQPGASSKTQAVETPNTQQDNKLYGASRILAALQKEKR